MRGGQAAHLRYKTFPSSSVLFFLTPFCPEVFPQALLLQTVTARHSLNPPVGPRGWCVCVSTAAAFAHPTFHQAFVLLGHLYSPNTGFPKRFPWSQGWCSCCPSLKLAAHLSAVLLHLREPCVRVFPQGFSLMLLGEGQGEWGSGRMPLFGSLALNRVCVLDYLQQSFVGSQPHPPEQGKVSACVH